MALNGTTVTCLPPALTLALKNINVLATKDTPEMEKRAQVYATTMYNDI